MGPYVAQALAALVANLTIVSAGMIFGWPSPSLPKLIRQPDTLYDKSELSITPEEASWVVSLASFGAIIGPLLSSLVVDRIGRKWSLNTVAVPLFISWLIIGLASSAEMLYLGRFIGGLSVGSAYCVMPMYVGEIAEDKIRGALGTLISISPIVGEIISFSIGPFVSREMLAGLSIIPVTIFLIVIWWMPETPYFFLMTANLTMLSIGMIFAWPTASLPKLLEQPGSVKVDGELRITPEEGSWVVSITILAASLGPIIVNQIVDRIGRKRSLIIIILPMLISWVIVGLAESVEVLYVGRFIGGVSLGGIYGVIPMYIGEIAENRIRGALATVMVSAGTIGHLITVSIGPLISLKILSLVSIIPIVMFLITSPWMPETPYFWLIRGAREEAAASLIWLRQKNDINEELDKLDMLVMEEQKRRVGIGELFRTLGNRKALIISIGLMSFQQFSGTIAINAYAGLIFESSGMTGWADLSLIILSVVNLLTGICVIFVVDTAGRRPILMTSSLFTAFFLVCEAVFFHAKDLGYETSSFSWVPLVGIAGFQIAIVPGLSCIPWLMIGELFPTNVKASANMFLAIYGSVMGFTVSKMYEPISAAVGIHWVYYIFAMITFFGIFFVYVYVPETKRHSFEDIQGHLNSNCSMKSKITIRDSCKNILTR